MIILKTFRIWLNHKRSIVDTLCVKPPGLDRNISKNFVRTTLP